MRGLLKPIRAAGWAGIVAAKAVAFFPSVFARPTARADLVRQLYATGIRTLPVITVVSLFMGSRSASSSRASTRRSCSARR